MANNPISFDLQGADELSKKLKDLSSKMQKRGVKRAARKSMAVVRNAARQNAKGLDDPKTAQRLWKNIIIKAKVLENGDVLTSVAVKGGVSRYANTDANVRRGIAGKKYETRGDKKNAGGDTFYWYWVEFGTSHAPAKPFLRPALRQNIQAVTDGFLSELNEEIAKAIQESA